jgi:endoglucanase
MKGYNDTLATQCLQIATEVWNKTDDKNIGRFVPLAVELLLTTGDKKYADFLVKNKELIAQRIDNTGWMVGRTLKAVNDSAYTETITAAVKKMYANIQQQGLKTPYGVPYDPTFGEPAGESKTLDTGNTSCVLISQLSSAMSICSTPSTLFLGCHPGSNTSSFVSGVGAKSMTTAYGFNRADRSYIPAAAHPERH